jgi:hypothetical protein|tara:strand:+ start:7397 stop:7807 length:411 start_codon:yes stop_codon:yes gene_type:complete
MSSLQIAETTGRVEDGQLTIAKGDRATLEAAIRQLPTGEYGVRVSRLAGTRTAAANAYYYAVLRKISAVSDISVPELHDGFKQRFIPAEPTCLTNTRGDVVELPGIPSSRQLSVSDFYDYTERVTAFACEFWGMEF